MSECVCVYVCVSVRVMQTSKFNWVRHLYLMRRKSSLPVNVSLSFAYSSLLCLASSLACQIQVSVAFYIEAFYKIIYSLAFMDPRYLWLPWHCYTYTKFYLAAPQGFWVSVIAVTTKPASFCGRKCMAHCQILRVKLEISVLRKKKS